MLRSDNSRLEVAMELAADHLLLWISTRYGTRIYKWTLVCSKFC